MIASTGVLMCLYILSLFMLLLRQALAARNVIVCNIPDYGTEEIASHAIGLALALRRGIALYHDRLRSKPIPAEWQAVSTPLVSRIRDQVFGILGMGGESLCLLDLTQYFNSVLGLLQR